MVLLGAMLFGTNGIAQALGPSAPPRAVGAVRVIVGGAILLAVALSRRCRFESARSMPLVTLALGAAVACYQTLFFSGIVRTGVAVGSIVTVATTPAATGLVGYLLNRDVPSRRWFLATVLAIAGTVAVSGLESSGHVDALGLVMCVASGVSVGVYTVLTKRLLLAGSSVLEVSTVEVALSGLLLVPVLVTAGTGWLRTGPGLALAGYLGVVTTAVGFSLIALGLSRIRPATAATLGLAEPVTAAVLAVLILDERFSGLQVAGAAAVAVALVFIANEPVPVSPAVDRDESPATVRATTSSA
jgi:DME family drug/metabolite transporter